VNFHNYIFASSSNKFCILFIPIKRLGFAFWFAPKIELCLVVSFPFSLSRFRFPAALVLPFAAVAEPTLCLWFSQSSRKTVWLC
jgi:hypothetical protein